MLSPTMLEALSRQINAEFTSSYVYRSMQAYFSDLNLDGMASWMEAQAGEEQVHALKLFNFVLDRGEKVTLTGIDTPPHTWESPVHAFEDALHHEQKITAMINDLMDKARSENDHASQVMLNWFVEEQVEEEASVDRVVSRLKMADGSPTALLLIDSELANRKTEEPDAE
jgi:ferritin